MTEVPNAVISVYFENLGSAELKASYFLGNKSSKRFYNFGCKPRDAIDQADSLAWNQKVDLQKNGTDVCEPATKKCANDHYGAPNHKFAYHGRSGKFCAY